MITTALLVTACAFAFVHGTNSGGTLVAMGLTMRSIRPLGALVITSTAVALAPVLLGTSVATTIARDLVPLAGSRGQLAMMAAVIASVAVTAVLARRGIPTNLTLALMGGIAGVGVGARLPVSWGGLGFVFVITALAPLAGGLVAVGLVRLTGLVGGARDAGRRNRRLHVAAFVLLSAAYGSNDAQKMLAVFAVAAGTVAGQVRPVWWQLAAIGLLFAVGTATGLRSMAGTIGTGVVPVRPQDATTAELSTAAVMLASSALGAPVGLAQTLSGALIGCGVTHGIGRVRWRQALRIATAWLVTLPAAFAVGLALGVVVSLV